MNFFKKVLLIILVVGLIPALAAGAPSRGAITTIWSPFLPISAPIPLNCPFKVLLNRPYSAFVKKVV
jgi:hypothetical protein